MLERIRSWDPRWYQIGALSFLLFYGLFFLHFEVRALQAIVIVLAMLATQWVCTRIFKAPRFEWKSALISAIGLTILLRSNHLWLLVIACVLSILPKFLIRWQGKHIFNPTNGAIVLLLLLDAPVWVSAGQWGNFALFAFLMACFGSIVVVRSARWDVSFAFIIFFAMLLFGRSLYLGEPLTIPWHRLQSGALVMFTFHMISDPKTTPDHPVARLIYAALIAIGAFIVYFVMFRTNGLFWSLFVVSPLVPLFDRFMPAARFTWSAPTRGSDPPPVAAVPA